MDIQPEFFGLLFVSKQDFFYNLKDRGSDAVDRFAEMASLCAQSAAYFGHRFALVTNDRANLEARYKRLGVQAPVIIEEQFEQTSLPTHADYFSAHHKLDLLHKFSTGRYGAYPCLVDIDTVFLKSVDLARFQGKPAIIDMSYKMIDDEGRSEVERVIESLTRTKIKDTLWYGGEFISGTPEFFARLNARISEYWPRYIAQLDHIFHNGDETVLSAALNSLRAEYHEELIEIGKLEIGTRWESSRTSKIQMSHRKAFQHNWLHLPSDKAFLARFAYRQFSPEAFLEAHRRYYFKRKLARDLYNLIENPLRGRKLYMSAMD